VLYSGRARVRPISHPSDPLVASKRIRICCTNTKREKLWFWPEELKGKALETLVLKFMTAGCQGLTPVILAT
jgi:hypothetical protein